MRNDHFKQEHVLILRATQAKRNALTLGLVTLFVFMTSCYSAIAQVGPDAPGRRMPNLSTSRPPNKPPDRAYNRPVQRSNEASRARGLFISKKSDAMSILVLKVTDGTLVPVDPSTEFKAGDRIKILFQSNFEGYIYIVNIEPNGKRKVLFPYPEASDNSVSPDERYDIPPGTAAIEFDTEKGTEVLQVIMSPGRIPYLDAAIKEPEQYLSESGATAAAELQGGIAKKVTPVVPQGEGSSKVRSRDIILAPGRDKDAKGSVVAIPDNGSGGKLKSGEIATFEIRLKHN